MKENLEQVVNNIKKNYGNESIMIIGKEKPKDIKTSSSGSLLLDNALGIGGYPVGRIIEIFGPESSGKTTVALHAIAEIQKNGGTAAFIDAENAIDISYARNLGVDTDNLVLSQPDSGEQALEITNQLIQSKAIDIIVIDSVAALVPQAELDGEMTDQSIGLQARLMSKGLRKMTRNINQQNVIVIFINQLREKVGVIYGSPEVTSGGKALKFYSSIRIDIRKSDMIKKNNELIGIKSKLKVVKNKVAAPFKIVEIDILYGKGISKMSEVINIAIDMDLIKKSGSWYSIGETWIGQGLESVKSYLLDNIELYKEIENRVKEK